MKYIKKVWKRWLKIASIIGNFQAQVIFTIFYFLLLWIVGLTTRFFSDPLNIKSRSLRSTFAEWDHPYEDLGKAHKPY